MYHFYDPIYDIKFTAIFETNRAKTRKKFEKLRIPGKFDDTDSSACTRFYPSKSYIIFEFHEELDYDELVPLMSHEAMHAVQFALNSRDVAIDVMNNEHVAYYLQFIMGRLIHAYKQSKS